MNTIKKYTVAFDDNLYLHMNPIKTIQDPLKLTDDLAKSKLWEKRGMVENWLKNQTHIRMMNRDGLTPKIECVEILLRISDG